ncbi:hypothetical protein HPG69_002133, partial [Diceros bicornis minor]
MNSKELYSTLHITASQSEDSATYLCAVRHSAPRCSAACTQTAAGPAAPPLPWSEHVAPTVAFAQRSPKGGLSRGENQERGKGPQHVIDIHSIMKEKEDQRLTVLLDKTAKHLSLHIAATQPGDSAVYFCATSTRCFPDTCNLYDTSSVSYSLFWYKQPSSGAMMFLIHQNSCSRQNATKGRYSLNFQKANKFINLVISASQLKDSAVYFCVLRYPILFWYVQYPDEGPQLLLRATKANEKGSNKGFEATYDTETTSFHLEKASIQESDSAVYYCALRVSGKNQVEQSPPSLIIVEGENCTFQCNYTVSPFSNLRWYKLDTGRGPVSLITMTRSGSKKLNGRYTVTVDTTTQHSFLHITAAQL